MYFNFLNITHSGSSRNKVSTEKQGNEVKQHFEGCEGFDSEL